MPISILIVDDAIFMRNMIRDIFNSSEFVIVGEAANGFEAVEKYKVLHPTLVWMDLVMPLLNGNDATKEILSFDKRACILICGALGQEIEIMKAIENGAVDFIVKPFEPSDVIKVVKKIIKAKNHF